MPLTQAERDWIALRRAAIEAAEQRLRLMIALLDELELAGESSRFPPTPAQKTAAQAEWASMVDALSGSVMR